MRPVAVLASRVRYEEKRIFTALERRGVPYAHVDTRRFSAELGGGTAPGGRSADADGPLYAAALNREISHSRGLYASMLLEARGVPTVNRSEVIAVCGDKLRTSLELERAGVPAPRTAVALTPDEGAAAAERLGFPLVIKPLTGSWGRLAAAVRDRDAAQTVLEHRAALPSPLQHIVYLQELVDKPGRDIRVIVAGDTVVGATYRYADGWRTNTARGARSEPCPLTPELVEPALRAARAVGGGILGVDLIEGPRGPLVLEVNHNVEFRGFQDAHGEDVDVADAIVSHVLEAA
ncbi:lysine biosynthesis protein LysX [Actinomadura citrea]|uniref:[lysine-biosynthesis-protein LysW]--L-2-aminoadipate ligase n=1 Tax=Actinomadura citrea TaxID=46158 RepID=A0A7Y9KI69_9ACTN|nr:lysine biosynthesis protein LysX [Actinomadura citrea]NYE16479.1 [lysine-biosynthesis-protein LysW]--L-2-aminoadipate ligase [Actinomadura citrea]GGT55905.1 lysine biosynthesis enzyme LysX [Actinomadura citrea]